MDIVAHGLWVGIGLAAAGRRWVIPRRTLLAAMGLAVLPDLAQLLPLVVLAVLEPGGFAVLTAYSSALPGLEPRLPAPVALLTHHLHCIMHSAVVAGVVTGAVWFFGRSFLLPLLGWWSHILIDVFTHSAEFYPVPVLYPFTQQGFDGLAWTTPWFMVANYVALTVAGVALFLTRRSATVP